MVKKLLKFAAYCIFALWVLGGAVVYYGRFSNQFYREHKGAMLAALESIRDWL